jgi:hypothetical protein
VIYDYSGPLAGGGSDLHALGAKIMIDHFVKNGRGGRRSPSTRPSGSKEGYSAMAPDLSALVTKLKRGRPSASRPSSVTAPAMASTTS